MNRLLTASKSKRQTPAVVRIGLCLIMAISLMPVADKVSAQTPAGKQNAAASNHSSPTSPANKAEMLLLARGARLHKEGKVDDAEAIFRDVLAKNPQSVDAFFDLGAIAEARGDLIGALTNYRAALALRPSDRELKEAVSSMEKTIKHNASASNKVTDGGSATSHTLTPVTADKQPPEVNLAPAADKNPPAAIDPQLSVPLDEGAPKTADSKTFQLSSRKGEYIPPTLGITPDQFPDLPVGLNGQTTTNTCPPPCPPTLTVGQNQNSTGTTKFRRAASLMLTVGAGAALNMSGLHCPICHMLNGH